ncbi:MAG: YegS/Rv2252/BmrU family lipid kinase [Bacteroidota bacterium]|nr:YegS/Rv2252/BmrU family lipid kinase [Bacteroidota bacterium]MDP4249883.1 YegS/Rv2252/BmrU family lipid kinase [Bacteroidota bacterium]
MMPRKIIYLINPISGTKKKAQVRELISRKTRERGIAFEILSTNASGDYDFLQKKVREEKITDVVICGGDGTVNAVVKVLQKIPVNIGIIPLGSGNGLAFAAKIPKQTVRALEVIFNGKSYGTDAFYINEDFSCMLCGIGFDALVAHAFAKQKKRGLQTYIRVSTMHFFKARPYLFEIRLNDSVLKTDAFFISVANGNQFGNNFTIAPKASLEDGLLDIVIVKKMNKLLLPFSVLRQLSGANAMQTVSDYAKNKNILYLQTDRLSIRNPHHAPLHIDGDPRDTSGEFNIRIIKNCFRLLRPEQRVDR